MSKFIGWLSDVLREVKDAWPYRKPAPPWEPLYGPSTRMQAYMYDLWEDEILHQAKPVLRFYQFNVNNYDEYGNRKGAPDA
jgi:hypothetical protein